MLDWKRVVNDPQTFKTALLNRGMEALAVESIFSKIESVAKMRLQVIASTDALKNERNKISQEVAGLMKSGKKSEAEPLIKKGKDIGDQVSKSDAELSEIESRFSDIFAGIPNMPHATVPVGKSASDNKVVRQWGEKRKFNFTPMPHEIIGEASGGFDFERAGKVSGARFTFLRGNLARLERALANWMMDVQASRGYEEVIPPYMVNAESLYGTGQLPKFEEDLFKIQGQDKFLIPTAEVPVTNLFRGEVLEEEVLPRKFVGVSPCFRSEAGSYGRDTKGYIRQHQFHKVELVKFTTPEQSQTELEGMVSDAEDILRRLEIPYQVVLLCTGDMGFGATKTYDIEVWLPGSLSEGAQGVAPGCYREISSCSDCGDFQARRANLRFKKKAEKGTFLLHTLNGSGLAVGRTLIAVLENYQEADGRVRVPKVLQSYMGGLEYL